MRPSLEEERRALLEEIEARRGLYRRMLSGENEEARRTSAQRQTIGHAIPTRHKRLGQWMLDHPFQVATSVALLVWLGPRLIRRNRRSSKTAAQAPAAGQRTGIPKVMASMMMLCLRDPRQLQTTASMIRNAWRWLRHETSPQTHPHGRKPYA